VNTNLLYSAYRELVHSDEAEKYFAIVPSQQANIIPMQAPGS
jgi:hypothetical protein